MLCKCTFFIWILVIKTFFVANLKMISEMTYQIVHRFSVQSAIFYKIVGRCAQKNGMFKYRIYFFTFCDKMIRPKGLIWGWMSVWKRLIVIEQYLILRLKLVYRHDDIFPMKWLKVSEAGNSLILRDTHQICLVYHCSSCLNYQFFFRLKLCKNICHQLTFFILTSFCSRSH